MGQEGGWVSPQHGLGERRLKPSAVGGQEKLYGCIPWGSEIGVECWIQGTSQRGQDDMWWVRHLMGWEAGAGLVLLPLVHLDLFVVLQETLLPVHGAEEVALLSVGSMGGEHRPHSYLWCGEVNQIFPFLPFPPEDLRCLFRYPSCSWHVQKLLPSWRDQSLACASWLPQPGADLLGSRASSSPNFSLHQLEENTWLCQLLVF